MKTRLIPYNGANIIGDLSLAALVALPTVYVLRTLMQIITSGIFPALLASALLAVCATCLIKRR